MHFFVLAFTCLSFTMIGQYSSPEVTATAGGSAITSFIALDWTLGEPVILSLEGASSTITCGFHQSDQICNGDFNFDSQINTSDLLIMLTQMGCNGLCLANLTDDTEVNTSDLLIFLGIFGNSCY
jgi:hypothetical protein